MCNPLMTLILKESCPAWGWQRCWEIDEHAGLWLGGMLQWRSWLWGWHFHQKISAVDSSISTIISVVSWIMMNMWMLECMCVASADYWVTLYEWRIMHLCILLWIMLSFLFLAFMICTCSWVCSPIWIEVFAASSSPIWWSWMWHRWPT